MEAAFLPAAVVVAKKPSRPRTVAKSRAARKKVQ
jgi:hypothetical protein